MAPVIAVSSHSAGAMILLRPRSTHNAGSASRSE